jgi:hypothetical protein
VQVVRYRRLPGERVPKLSANQKLARNRVVGSLVAVHYSKTFGMIAHKHVILGGTNW